MVGKDFIRAVDEWGIVQYFGILIWGGSQGPWIAIRQNIEVEIIGRSFLSMFPGWAGGEHKGVKLIDARLAYNFAKSH